MSQPTSPPLQRRRGRPPTRSGNGDLRAAAIDAARHLLVDGGGGALSMEGLARVLGVRAPSLYYHFPGGRDEMILAVADHYSALDGAAISAILTNCEDPVAGMVAVARYFAEATTRHPYHTLAEQRETLKPDGRAELQRLFAERVEAPLVVLLRRAQAQGILRPLDAELCVRVFLTLALRLRDFEADQDQRESLPDFVVSLLVTGLDAGPAPCPLSDRGGS